MEIQNITPKIENHSINNYKKLNDQGKGVKQQFTGMPIGLYAIPAVFLRFLDTNQAWGANLVDVGSMVIPRSAYDMKHRGFATGMETARREATGTFNHSMVGVYGTFLGAALALGLNKAYDIKAHKIYANNETLNILGDNWYKALHSNSGDPLKTYLNNVVGEIKVYNPSSSRALDDGCVAIEKETKDLVVKRLHELISNPNTKDTIQRSDLNYLKGLITANTGGEKNVVLNGSYKGAKATADNTLEVLLQNIHNVTKLFNKEKVKKSFLENGLEGVDSVKILNSLKKLNIQRSMAGLAFAAAFGMSVQPINMYLTKKRTGIDGFPGVPGRKKDDSAGFKILKSIMAVLFGAGAISTILIGGKSTAKLAKNAKFSDKVKMLTNKFLARIQFRGAMPTINQLKFVYGMTIVSRLFVARDKNELREATVKDTLGFLNLLILGALVTKGATGLMNKKLINMPKDVKKGFISWLKNSSVKSRDEVLLETLGKYGIGVVKDGKALSYKELLNNAKKLPQHVRKDLMKNLYTLDIAQLIGYAYSGIFLGYYLPKINASMSNANEEKRIAKVAKEQGKTVEQVKAEMQEELKKLEAQMEERKKAKKSKKQNFTSSEPNAADFNRVVAEAQKKDFFNRHMA